MRVTRTWVFIIAIGIHFMSNLTVMAQIGQDPASVPYTTFSGIKVDNATGSAGMSVPIQTLPGRRGIEPNLQLSYSSQAQSGPAGLGWNVSMGFIQRSTKNGVPRYDAQDEFVFHEPGSGSQELVFDAATGFYRTRIEGGFAKIEKLADSWQVTDKRGTKYFFGRSAASRQYDESDPARVFQWALDRIEDVHGNYLTVSYLRDQGQLFIEKTEYTGNAGQGLLPYARVRFEYEDRPDAIVNFRPGFKSETRKRLARIAVEAESRLVRAYRLAYEQDKANGRSLLKSVTQTGSDNASTLPPVTFAYYQHEVKFRPAVTLNHEVQVNNSHFARLADLNGDGFVDFIRNFSGQTTFEIFTHDGRENFRQGGFDAYQLNASASGYYNVLPMDMNNDGLIDMVDTSRRPYYLYRNTGTRFELAGSPAYSPNAAKYGKSDWTVENIDIDGDGLDDFLLRNSYHGAPYWAYRNTGDFNFAAPVQLLDLSGINFDMKPSDVQYIDINADGLTDFYDGSHAGQHYVYINQGGYRFAKKALGIHPDARISDRNLHSFVDINCDGLPDIIGSVELNIFDVLEPKPYRIYFNNGKNDFSPAVELNFPDGGIPTTQLGAIRFLDMNSDGCTDIVYSRTHGHDWRVLVSNGHDGFKEGPGIASPDGSDLNHFLIAVTDLNSDGYPDIIFNGKAWYQDVPAHMGPAGALVKTDNGIGVAMEMGYGREPIGLMPGARFGIDQVYNTRFLPVVKSSKQTARNSVYISRYDHGGIYWDHSRKELSGFASVKAIDADGNYSESEYFQDALMRGRPREERVYDAAGRLFAKTAYEWKAENLAAGADFIYLKRKDSFVYDGKAVPKRTAELYFYEEVPQYGDMTKTVQLGEVHPVTGADIGEDSRSVETSYVHNPGRWLLGLPKTAVSKNHRGEIVRQTTFAYDQSASGAAPLLPYAGLLTEKRQWAGTGLADPVTRHFYDGLGNLVQTKDPRGHYTTIVYDAKHKLFPVTTINALNHTVKSQYYGVNESVEAGYTGLWGQLKSVTDPNNQTGRRIYDVFGRMIKSVSPMDSLNFPTTETRYAVKPDHLLVVSKQRVEHNTSKTIDTYQFMDGLGRLIHTKSPAATDGAWRVSGLATYTPRGQEKDKFLPYFSSLGPEEIEPVNMALPRARLEYDAAGRPVKTINPDGTYATMHYDQWTSAAVNENGHKQESVHDAYGRLVEKREYTGADGRFAAVYPASPYTLYASTRYEYDSEGNLTGTIDAYGNRTSVTYDKLGRKTAMDDPDMGLWQYAYDAAGNMIEQIDAKGRSIYFQYDPLSRLKRKYDQADADVNYSYDNTAVANAKGRITQAAYNSTESTDFRFDAVGRETQAIKNIDGRPFDVKRSHNALEQITDMQYPDGGKLYYQYNNAGEIQGVGTKPGGWHESRAVCGWLCRTFGTVEEFAFGVKNAHAGEDELIYDPLPGGIIRAGSHEFRWNAVPGALEYYFKAGSYPGGDDLFERSVGTSRFAEVEYIPEDIDRIYVVLWARSSSGWMSHSRDYAIDISSPQQFQPARLSAPAPGTPLTSGEITFSWTAGAGVTGYYFAVATSAAKLQAYPYGDIVAGNTGGLTSRKVTGIPLNGSPVYVRLWSKKPAGLWVYEDYSFPTRAPRTDEQFVENVSYNANGQITMIQYGNGLTTTSAFDPLSQRLVRKQTRREDGTVLQDFQYKYDGAGNVIEITDNANRASQTFAYDALGRLVRAENPGGYGLKTYRYDAIGNILEKDGKTYTYGEAGAGPHAVTRVSGGGEETTMTYDANGNMATKQSGGRLWQYFYDGENRLARVRHWGDNIAAYTYDGDGGRQQWQVYRGDDPRETISFVGGLYEENDATGAGTRHIHFGDMRVASVEGGQAHYYLTDHLGSTNVVTDAYGEVVEISEYEPFGAFSRRDRYGSDGAAIARYYFTNQFNDEDTGLYYYRARYYDPQLGRFIQADTFVPQPGSTQAFNRYSYVYNNPVAFTDPSGNFPWLAAIGAIVGAAAGGISAHKNGQPVWQGVFFGGLQGFGSGLALGSSFHSIAQNGHFWNLTRAAGGLSLAGQVAGAAGNAQLQRNLNYGALGLGGLYLGLNIGVGVKSWIHEPDARLILPDGSTGTAADLDRYGEVFVPGITMGGESAVNIAKNNSLPVFDNPTHGPIADFTESFLEKVTFTGSVDRQFASILSLTTSNIRIISYSQGTLIASNALLQLGFSGRNFALQSQVIYKASAISQLRAFISSSMAGMKHIYKTNVFDPINVIAPNLNPVFLAGGIYGGMTRGITHHSFNLYGL